jgi:hypothetical protein
MDESGLLCALRCEGEVGMRALPMFSNTMLINPAQTLGISPGKLQPRITWQFIEFFNQFSVNITFHREKPYTG